MKFRIFLFLTLATLLASPAARAEIKVGFVDTIRLMENAPQAKTAFTQIESEFEPRNKELVEMQKKIKALEEKFTRDGAVMSEDERARQDREIRNQKRELQRLQEEFREDLNIRRNEEIAKLQRTLFTAIEALGKEENYDVILVESGVVFRSERIDITDKVLERLKQGVASDAK